MGLIWIREFTGGLDTRRMAETTSGGALIVARNGHISRGGEFEKRAAFVPTYTLPAGTISLAAGADNLTVFGSGPTPGGLPTDLRYQRLQHPDGTTPLVRVRSYDLFSSKIYVVGEFADGSIFHFYDGVRVDDWFDGRARASFDVTGGSVTPAVAAVGSFTITGGTSGAGNQITSVSVAGVSIMGGAVAHTGDNATTAAAVATAINTQVSSPDYTATSVGGQVIIAAAVAGAAANGRLVSVVVGGDATVGSVIDLAGGANQVSSQLADLRVNGVSVIGAPVAWTTSNTDMAADIVSAINSFTSSPDYSAVAVGTTVSITAAAQGSAPNGYPVDFTLANGLTVSPSVGLALANGSSVAAAAATGSFTVTGGTSNPANTISMVTVGGVNVMASAVTHTGNNSTTAAAVAAAINSFSSSPDYTAVAVGAVVTITATLTGAAANGRVVSVSVAGNATVGSISNMAGGVDEVFQPGSFVRTAGKKMYSTSKSILHFSGIATPDKWTTDNVGAGFIDMASETSGSEQLTAIAKYLDRLAVFGENTTIILYIDPDPALNRLTQTLNNTGTLSPRSVTQFGDSDLFYLDESGLRSLRARDSSNAAATTDIGVPVDTLVTAKLASFSLEERADVIGAIEPRDGRFWLAMKDEIFVFSFFNGAKVSAWSTYTPSYFSAGQEIQFEVEDMVVFSRRVYVRSGNTIFVYGGTGSTLQYDATVAEGWTPYLDANSPTTAKKFTGVDAALEGAWEISVAFDPTNLNAEDKVSSPYYTTFMDPAHPGIGEATHVSLRFRTTGDTYARLSSAVIHYEGGDIEDK
ncbi:MAG: hypothetical protein ACOVN5_07135 [Aquidulcibacter sp.]